MALTSIVTEAEIVTMLGLSSTNALLAQVIRLVERAVRRHLGIGITQATYTHYMPEARGVHLSSHAGSIGRVLRLPEYPLRSITSLYEDEGSYAGTEANAFDSNSLLTEGEDFYGDYSQDGYAHFGHVVRLHNNWPSEPRSVKITYSAGWSAAELNGNVSDARLDASDIKLAVLKAVSAEYNESLNNQPNDGSAGTIASEAVEGYSVSYDLSQVGPMTDLPEDVKKLLHPFKRMTGP